MSNHENHDGPFMVTGRHEYSPFYGRTLFSSWDIWFVETPAFRPGRKRTSLLSQIIVI